MDNEFINQIKNILNIDDNSKSDCHCTRATFRECIFHKQIFLFVDRLSEELNDFNYQKINTIEKTPIKNFSSLKDNFQKYQDYSIILSKIIDKRCILTSSCCSKNTKEKIEKLSYICDEFINFYYEKVTILHEKINEAINKID